MTDRRSISQPRVRARSRSRTGSSQRNVGAALGGYMAFGEMADIVSSEQRLTPTRAMGWRYEFKFAKLEDALRHTFS